MTDGLLVALVGFFAAIVGGTLQAWTARRFEVTRFQRQNRNQAYLAYLNGIGRISFARSADEIDAAHAHIAEARGRIALSGSTEVVLRMTKVFSNGADTHSPKARQDLTALLVAMRRDTVIHAESADADALFILTFGDGPTKEIS